MQNRNVISALKNSWSKFKKQFQENKEENNTVLLQLLLQYSMPVNTAIGKYDKQWPCYKSRVPSEAGVSGEPWEDILRAVLY